MKLFSEFLFFNLYLFLLFIFHFFLKKLIPDINIFTNEIYLILLPLNSILYYVYIYTIYKIKDIYIIYFFFIKIFINIIYIYYIIFYYINNHNDIIYFIINYILIYFCINLLKLISLNRILNKKKIKNI